jgi:hypothetical protein
MSLSTDQRVNMSLDDLIKAKSSEARSKKGKKVGAAKSKTLIANVNKAAGSAGRRARKDEAILRGKPAPADKKKTTYQQKNLAVSVGKAKASRSATINQVRRWLAWRFRVLLNPFKSYLFLPPSLSHLTSQQTCKHEIHRREAWHPQARPPSHRLTNP